MSAWIWIPVIAVLGLALLLFPSGRSPSARWRLAAWAAIAGTGASLALGAALWSQRGLGLLTVGDEFPGWKVKAMGLSSSGAWRSGGLR